VPRILIVDDEGAIRTLLSTAFEMAGYEVRTAPDGPEAMELCAAESFDAILSDVRMPRMNGHDLARWVAARCPRTRLVLMSGFDMDCDECSLATRCQLLPKPFRPAAAVSLVRQALAAPPPPSSSPDPPFGPLTY
jgi:CheY-like chemotaxis protein